jgi:hypothetical protein
MLQLDATNSFGLLFMTIGANYTGNLLSCDIQRHFTNNIFSKHLIAFFLLFFFVVLINKDNILKNKEQDSIIIPEFLLNAIIIYIIFLICTRMEFLYTAYILTSVVVYMLLDLEKSNKSPDKFKLIEEIQSYIKYLAIGVGLVGFIKYFIKQYTDHNKDFSLLTFIFGTNKCNNVN